MTEAAKIELRCPYCDQSFKVESDDRHPGESPKEIECMPYTRPKGEWDLDRVGIWSKIGLDFFFKVNWEVIGILRMANDDTTLDVSYQLARCPRCERLFDTYLNWTPDRDFGEIWPHLLARDAQGAIRRYQGLTFTLGTLQALKRRMGGTEAAVGIVVLLLFALSFVPRLLIVFLEQSQTPWQYFWEESAIPLVTRVLGAVVLFGLLRRFLSYVQFMHEDQDFYQLFAVQKPREHTTHWLNYSLARFVGVQKPGRYAITQTAVLAGIPSAVVLICMWLMARLGNLSSGLPGWANLGALVVLMAGGYLLGGWLTLRRTQEPVTMDALLFPIVGPRLRGLALGVLLWGGLAIVQMVLADPGHWYWVVDALFEVAFWAVVAYYIGLGLQFAFSSGLYMLFQMSRLPLNLHPLRGFRNLAPLQTMIKAMTSVLMLEVSMVILIAALQFIPWQDLGITLAPSHVLGSTSWLFDWAHLGLAIVFAILGVVVSPMFPLGAVLYLALVAVVIPASLQGVPDCAGVASGVCAQTGLGIPVLQIPIGQTTLPFLPTLVVQGIFLSLIVFAHMKRSGDLLVSLRQKAKDKLLNQYEERIVALSERVASPESQAAAGDAALLRELIQLHDQVSQVRVRERPFRQVANVLSPLLFSIVLPTLVQWGIERILS